MSTNPGRAVASSRVNPELARGADERFTGYGAMGVPHTGGHYLVFRDMVATSLGTPYRAIWHRDSTGHWTIFTTVAPNVSCPRYFGSVTAVERVPAIEVSWPDDWTIDICMGSRLSWRLELKQTPATRTLSSMASFMPGWSWNNTAVLASMGLMASGALRSGRMRLSGRTPNGQRFKAAPLRVWRVIQSHAVLDGIDLGVLGAWASQAHLGDFWLPQRGLFFVGQARFTPPAPRLNVRPDLHPHATTEREDHDRSTASTDR